MNNSKIKIIFLLWTLTTAFSVTHVSQQTQDKQNEEAVMSKLHALSLDNLPGSYHFQRLADLSDTALAYSADLVKKDIEQYSIKNTEKNIQEEIIKHLLIGTVFSLPLYAINIFLYIKNIKASNKSAQENAYYKFQKILNTTLLYKDLSSIEFNSEEKERLNQLNKEMNIYNHPFVWSEWIYSDNLDFDKLSEENKETLRYIALDSAFASYVEQKKLNKETAQNFLSEMLFMSSMPFFLGALPALTYRKDLKKNIKDKQNVLNTLIEEQQRRSTKTQK